MKSRVMTKSTRKRYLNKFGECKCINCGKDIKTGRKYAISGKLYSSQTSIQGLNVPKIHCQKCATAPSEPRKEYR